MDKDEILAEIGRYVDDGEYQDPQERIDLLTAIRAYISLRCGSSVIMMV
jgi:thioredoxin-related protein